MDKHSQQHDTQTKIDKPQLSARRAELLSRLSARLPQMLDDLRRYVLIDTGPGTAADAGLRTLRDLIGARLAALGAEMRLVPGAHKPAWLAVPDPNGHADTVIEPPSTLIARAHRHDGPAVLLAGHLDTVHPCGGAFRGLEASADGRFVRGPGAVDMKGGLVLVVHALEVLAELGIACNWTVLLNSDEETGSFASADALRDEAARTDAHGQRVYCAGLAVEPAIGGPASQDGTMSGLWKLASARGGSGQCMIEVTGKRAHVGRDPASGISAVAELCRRLLAAQALTDIAQGDVVNFSTLWCPDAPNVVPGQAMAWANTRFTGPDRGSALAAKLAALQTEGDALPRVRVQQTLSRPAKPATATSDALAQQYVQIAAAYGHQVATTMTGGVCDGNNLQAAGLATIDSLGVCGGGLHTTTEWVDVQSMPMRAACLAEMIAALAAER